MTCRGVSPVTKGLSAVCPRQVPAALPKACPAQQETLRLQPERGWQCHRTDVTVLMTGERWESNPSLLGLMGSASAALDGEVQNIKEKREGRALFDTRPCTGQPSLGPGGREQAASLLPPSPPWRDVAGWRSGQTSRPLASAAERGQLVSRTGAVLALAAWRSAVHPYSVMRAKEKALERGGRACGVGVLWL